MAKMIVKQVFCDKFNGRLYNEGERIEIADATRLKDLEQRGLAHAVESKTEKPAEIVEPKEKKTTAKRARK